MNYIVGITSDKTLKIKGHIDKEEVIVLFDIGASHNFISHELVRRLGILVEREKTFGVMVGNKVTVRGEGICIRIKMEIQRVMVQQDYFPFDLGGVDVVLGVSWLSSLGDMCANWKNLTMAFEVERRHVMLQGDPSQMAYGFDDEVLFGVWNIGTEVAEKEKIEMLDMYLQRE
ncbi:uncharacterized protein LOC116132121 [Pistacia vera]|uniref:uncharacterized protein LOC116132121 n=1 Tax=Pistacia vera TaxID=55513 RepID=UPI0012638D38|nr:uncharacterized protein LOC116132121 [Pistacia vera]